MLRACAWTLCLAVASSSAALAQESPAQPLPPIERPNWVRLPSGQDIARYFPPEARREKISGAAVISCGITDQGMLDACEVLEETPAGYGFGEAALKMKPLFKLRLTTKDGEPVAGRTVRIPIQMRIW